MKPKKLAVLDTCVVLSFLFGEPKGAVEGEEKHKRAKGEIQELVKEGYQIGVPVIVPAEVTSSKHADAVKDGWPTAGERHKKFMDFLQDSSELLIMEADSGVAAKAAEVGAEAPLKAADALILASALAYNAEVLVS